MLLKELLPIIHYFQNGQRQSEYEERVMQYKHKFYEIFVKNDVTFYNLLISNPNAKNLIIITKRKNYGQFGQVFLVILVDLAFDFFSS